MMGGGPTGVNVYIYFTFCRDVFRAARVVLLLGALRGVAVLLGFWVLLWFLLLGGVWWVGLGVLCGVLVACEPNNSGCPVVSPYTLCTVVLNSFAGFPC